MRKFYLCGFFLFLFLLLSGCFEVKDKEGMVVDENEIVNEDISVEDEVVNEDLNVEDEGKKTHLTFKDIDYLNKNLKPKGYHYESVDDKTHEVVKEGDDVFLEFDRVIAPLEYESMEITYSELSGDSMIETHVNYHFLDGSVYRVDYFNDRESLKYISAIGYYDGLTTTYTFNY